MSATFPATTSRRVDCVAALPRGAEARVDLWLSSGPLQRADGAVAGWVDERDHAAYVYPEITGYYLQWLAWRAREGDRLPEMSMRAVAAQRWLRAWLDSDRPPLTRIFRDPRHADWRNQALFSFDLAMVLRGLAAAARCELLAPDANVVAGVCAHLSAMVAPDGELDAVRVHAPDVAFPDRWSTRRGAFLAKAAAGIAYAAETLPGVPQALRTAADCTFVASLRALRDAPHAHTHPLLYAIEGYLNHPSHPDFAANLPMVAAIFDRLIERSRALGRVPEADHDPGQARLDIVAQALRIGVLLAHHRETRIGVPVLRGLAATLEAATMHDGAIPFVEGARPLQRNAWTAMFASQAFAWQHLDARGLADLAAQPLVV